MERRPARGPVAYAGEPGAFAEDAVLAAFGDVADGRRRQLPRGLRGRRGRAGRRPASCRSRTSSTARSARTTTCCSSTTSTIVGEVVVPVRLCLAALPGQRLDDIERVYSHIQALGQAEAFLRTRPWQLLTTYNTAGAGKSIADGASAARPPSSRRAPPRCSDSRSSRTTSRTCRGQPHAVPRRLRARRGCRRAPVDGRRPPPDDARPRGPQRARARCSRCSRCSPATAST